MMPLELVGVPWRAGGRDCGGVDCWGVVRLCVPNAPDYAASPDDARALVAAFAGGFRDERWRPLAAPRDGCVVSLGLRHVGVWWRGYVIHATREAGVRADPAEDMPGLGYVPVRCWEWAAA